MFAGSLRRTCFCMNALLIIQAANANAFLKANHKVLVERMSEADIQTSLLAEVESGLGSFTGSKVGELEALLRPIFNALPKNDRGGLGHTTVRYALHRMFVQRHGWYISGLDPKGQSWNGSDPAGVLKDQVPAYLQSLFEKRLAEKGFGLHDLAVLAATVEHLVHTEALGKLGAAFNLHERLPTSELNVTDANEILETYMMGYILGESSPIGSLSELKKLKGQMHEIYVGWAETRLFIREILDNTIGSAEQLNFAMMARAAERMGEQFGSFQNKECRELKASLLKVEDHGTGRVRLPDFYKPSVVGEESWQFSESVPYLRQLGALDESDPDVPRVIVVNYLSSQSNCLAASSFYSVCCMDECEGLLGHIENDLKAPEAPPARIAALVAGLPSSSVLAPRELSTTMRLRLDQIADTHGGTVPLHGRLFSQWLHHVYPRECPYPHVSGTTTPPQSMVDFKEESGEDYMASKDEMIRIIEQYKHAEKSPELSSMELEKPESIPWSHEEELLVVRPVPQSPVRSGWANSIRNVFLFAALSSFAIGLVQRGKSAAASLSQVSSEKFYV